MTENFNRHCFVSVAEQPPSGNLPVLIKQVVGFAEDGVLSSRYGLRISFHITKALDEVADQAVVKIWNLNPESRRALAQRHIMFVPSKPRYLQVSAGYERAKVIFNGAILMVTSTKTGPDWVTEIEAQSAFAQIMNNHFSKSYGQLTKVNGFTIANELINKSGLPSARFHPEAEAKLKSIIPDTFVVDSQEGGTYEKLRMFLRSLDLRFYADSDSTWVMGHGQPRLPPGTEGPLVIDKDSGLLGSPKAGNMGVDFRTLLDPRITPGRLCKVFSPSLAFSTTSEGGSLSDLIAWTIEMAGDTHSDDWFCDVKGLYYPLKIGTFLNLSTPMVGVLPQKGTP
jgi:hypothetical protein